MIHGERQASTAYKPLNYKIRVQGHLGLHWRDWFEGMTITTQPNGDTVLSGLMTDQAALHGVLKKVRNLGLHLVSVNPVAFKQTQTSKEETYDETSKS